MAVTARIMTASGAPVAPLGLGAREDRDPACVALAAERGVNFLFFYHLGGGAFAAAIAEVATGRREDFVIASGAGSRAPDSLRRTLESYLDTLKTDHLDIFFAEYIQPDEHAEAIFSTGGTLDELSRWKKEGAIRYVGATAHDRGVARRLAEDPRLDVLMTRYNMAHRKASAEVFPACKEHGAALVTFTSTRWGSLLEGHPDWKDAPPRAADCYRFCLAHPSIDVVLGAPQSTAELEENLQALDVPEMSDNERARWKIYGDLIYGDGTDAFETEWP